MVVRFLCTFASRSALDDEKLVIMKNEETLALEVLEVATNSSSDLRPCDILVEVNGTRVRNGLHHDQLQKIIKVCRYPLSFLFWRAAPPEGFRDIVLFWRPERHLAAENIFKVARNDCGAPSSSCQPLRRRDKRSLWWIAVFPRVKWSSSVITFEIAATGHSPSFPMLLPGDHIIGFNHSPLSTDLDFAGLRAVLAWFSGANSGGLIINIWRAGEISKARGHIRRKNAAAVPSPIIHSPVLLPPALSPIFWARDGLRRAETAAADDELTTRRAEGATATASLDEGGGDQLGLASMLSLVGDGLHGSLEGGLAIARRASAAVVNRASSASNRMSLTAFHHRSQSELLRRRVMAQPRRTFRGVVKEIGDEQCSRKTGTFSLGLSQMSNLRLQAELTRTTDHMKPWVFERPLWTGNVICDWRCANWGRGDGGDLWESSVSRGLEQRRERASIDGRFDGAFAIHAVIMLTDRALYILYHRGGSGGAAHEQPRYSLELKLTPWMLVDTVLPYYVAPIEGGDDVHEVAARSAEILLRFHADAGPDFEIQYEGSSPYGDHIDAAGEHEVFANSRVGNCADRNDSSGHINRNEVNENQTLREQWIDQHDDGNKSSKIKRRGHFVDGHKSATVPISSLEPAGTHLLPRSLMLRLESNEHRAELLEALCFWYEDSMNVTGTIKSRCGELRVETVPILGYPPLASVAPTSRRRAAEEPAPATCNNALNPAISAGEMNCSSGGCERDTFCSGGGEDEPCTSAATSDFIDIKRTLRPTVVRATIDEPHHEILLAGSSLSSSLIPLTSGTAALAEERRHDYDDGGSLGSTASTTRPLLSQRPRRLSLSGMLKDTKHFLFGGRNGGAI